MDLFEDFTQRLQPLFLLQVLLVLRLVLY